MRQLQVFGQLDKDSLPQVLACRDLVRAERWREEVMLGRRAPGYVLDAMPAWVQGMVQALELTARGEFAAADDVRGRSLDVTPFTSGHAGDTAFDWIADSDSRLGPVCEIMTAGSYRWLPFDDVASWQLAAPAKLMDLLWVSCSVTLHDGTLVRGFMPSRYPIPAAAHAGSNAAADRDALDLGHQTLWHECGRTGVIGDGRKTWVTSMGDVGLFDWPACTFARKGDSLHAPVSETRGASSQ